MARVKDRKKILHQPSTHEIFICLAYMQEFSKKLADTNPDKSYKDFLRWLIQCNFYIGEEHRITIKRIAEGFKSDTVRVTKWIKEIYEDICELDYERPELFQKEGIKVDLTMHYYDNFLVLKTALPALPREYEKVSFYFAKAKVSTDCFWVKEVKYVIEENSTTVTVESVDGFLNRYREFALDRAMFHGKIGYGDFYHMHPFELDDLLKKIYRD